MDYPGIEAIDQVKGVKEGNVKVTGSIVFVSDHSVLANHLWDIADAEVTGKQQCDSRLRSLRAPDTCSDLTFMGFNTPLVDNGWCWFSLTASRKGVAVIPRGVAVLCPGVRPVTVPSHCH